MKDISKNIEYAKKTYRRYPMSRKKLFFKSLQSVPRALTQNFRVLPDFIIIGAQKCGTSSVYFNLRKHKLVCPALTKEIRFFNSNYDRGINWYRKHFPLKLSRVIARSLLSRNIITGEASPDYIFHFHTPGRIHKALPDVKLIILLRNPVDRAYSQYQHYLREGVENLSFEGALEKEDERIGGELEKIKSDPYYYSYKYRQYSYKKKGIYLEQLKHWMGIFPGQQFLILGSEDFFRDPEVVYQKVLDFLELPVWSPESFGKYNVGKKYEGMKDDTRKKLIEFYKPHNQKLYDFLERDFGWDT